jgi:hypothetical protein
VHTGWCAYRMVCIQDGVHTGRPKASLYRNASVRNVPLNVEDNLNESIRCNVIGLPSNKFLDIKTILCQFTSVKKSGI